jgi:hypothetical protein
MTHVIEWAPFTVVEGTDERTLRAASEALQRHFLGKQPGFVRRELLRIDARRWVDLVVWTHPDAAAQAMKAAAASAACSAYFGLMVMPENPDLASGVTLLEPVASYATEHDSP